MILLSQFAAKARINVSVILVAQIRTRKVAVIPLVLAASDEELHWVS